MIINGFVSTMSMWDPALIEEMAKTHQVVLFDNRGVGLSTDTEQNNTTIPQMAGDAAGLIKALGLQKPDVIGWSMGARVAQQLVTRHPDAVDKVVLAAPLRCRHCSIASMPLSRPARCPTTPRFRSR